MIRFSDITLGTVGGAACRRCHGATIEEFREVDAIRSDIERAAVGWNDRLGPNLGFTGVEAFRHPAIAALLQAAIAAEAERIRVDSDAVALRSADAAHSALMSGVRHIRFPLLGSTPALHDALARFPASFDATVEGVRSFAQVAKEANLHVHVTALMPVCRHNLKDVPGVVVAASRAGARAVQLKLADSALNLRSAAPWLEAACDTGVVHATWVEIEGMPDELAAGWELHLASTDHRSGEVGEHV